MNNNTDLNLNFYDEEKVQYQKKIPTHNEIPEDSSSILSDLIGNEEGNWFSEDNKYIEFKCEHSVSVFDVAAFILEKIGSMTTMKLQKLAYYSQAWSLVWDEQPLFKENIEAWANGPVIKELFSYHRGQYRISSIPIGNSDILNDIQKETINAVLDYYASKSSQWIIDLTHMEDPWKLTRVGMPAMQRGNRVIKLDTIASYYSSLPPENTEN